MLIAKRCALTVAILVTFALVACIPDEGRDGNRPAQGLGRTERERDTSPGSTSRSKSKPTKRIRGFPAKTRTPRTTADGARAVVSRVIDGDTIEVLLRGSTIDVRLIGVDTPETVHPTVGVECFGKEASAFTGESLEGREVRLEFDVERRDRYGRTLAYVWLDGELFNETLVSKGFGQVSTYPPNVAYVDRFVAAQRDARRGDRGLWDGACSDIPEEASPSSAETASSGTGGKCDPNYTGACVPPYAEVGDLDCPDISATDFRSTGSDPHGFDGDADGVACES